MAATPTLEEIAEHVQWQTVVMVIERPDCMLWVFKNGKTVEFRNSYNHWEIEKLADVSETLEKLQQTITAAGAAQEALGELREAGVEGVT